ncbi:MAG: hypothetical protein AABY22_33830 [Nanoarchaeota archaeon]
MKITCDKCNMMAVIERQKNPPVEPTWSMEDIVNGKNEGTGFVTADIKWTDMVLECSNCGYSREYSRGSGGMRPISLAPQDEK